VATDEEKSAFLAAAPLSYLRMANFSFDYGNAHWTVTNPNVDWSDAALRDWVAKDIASVKSATWHFVGFHHPGFNSSKHPDIDQWMRRMSDVFEAAGVFTGHVHNYQRSLPLRFQSKPEPGSTNEVDASGGTLTIRQISKHGQELDHFVVTK